VSQSVVIVIIEIIPIIFAKSVHQTALLALILQFVLHVTLTTFCCFLIMYAIMYVLSDFLQEAEIVLHVLQVYPVPNVQMN
jgi:hypothetical protein